MGEAIKRNQVKNQKGNPGILTFRSVMYPVELAAIIPMNFY